MSTLQRYVLFELIKVFLLTLVSLTMLIFVVLIGKEAVDKGIGFIPLLRMVPYLLPQALQFAVPGTMLLATTSVYSRMSSYNEMLAVKALGISPMTVIWPTLGFATIMSCVTVQINDTAMSWGTDGVRRVFMESFEEVVYGQLRTHHAYNLDRASINVRDVQGHRLISPTFIVRPTNGKAGWSVAAEEAELNLIPKAGTLVMRFHNFQLNGPIKYEDPNTFEYAMKMDQLSDSKPKDLSPSFYALAEIPSAAEEQERLITQINDSASVQSAFGLLTGDFEPLSEETWNAHQRDREKAQYRLHRLYAEPWRRWANGFSCLSFVLIGIPVAIRLRFSEFLASFFACFLPILVVYYPLLAVSVDQAKDGAFPPQAVWLGNFVFAAAGIYQMYRMNRH